MLEQLEKNRIIPITITIAIAIVIFYISSLSFETGVPGGSSNLKATLYHIIIFLFLSFSLSMSLIKGKYYSLLPVAIIISLIYGISDELHQFLVPGRSTSVSDFFLNTIGIILGSTIYWVSLELRKNKFL
jgi:VanZ family protein